MPPIIVNQEAKRAANLRVLQRMDNHIIDIVGSATHVVLYEFNSAAQQWEKRNCEGSLFVVKRSDVPRFNMVVLNRSSKENLVVTLTSSFQMQVREPYLIFRLATNDSNEQKIHGIWFFNSEEREATSSVLERIVKTLDHGEGETLTKVDNAKSMSHTEATASLLSALRIDRKEVADNATAEGTDDKDISAQNGQEERQQLQSVELDKKSLQLSLMSLLQEEKFVDLIHAQYLKVVRARKKTSG